MLTEVGLEVLLTVTLVHVDLEVVMASEALVTHGTPHTWKTSEHAQTESQYNVLKCHPAQSI